jgi:hypothetical protein
MHLKIILIVFSVCFIIFCSSFQKGEIMGKWEQGNLELSSDNTVSRQIDSELLKKIQNHYANEPYLADAPGLVFFKMILHSKNNKRSYIFYPEDADDILIVYVYVPDDGKLVLENRFYYSVEN